MPAVRGWISSELSLRPGVIGNTPASGAGFRGSSPWGAVVRCSGLARADRNIRCYDEHELAMGKGKIDRTQAASEKRESVRLLLTEGLTQAEVGRRLALAKSTVSYHARRLGIPARDKCARRYDWDQIQRAHDAGLSVRACSERFGFALCSWHEAVKRGAIRPRPRRMPIDLLLVAGRTQTNRSHLKQRLLGAGLKAACCERCGLTEWLGEPLSLQLHHLNGDGTDNRLENLQLLCGNCHSQTDNWGGRGARRRSGSGSRKRSAC